MNSEKLDLTYLILYALYTWKCRPYRNALHCHKSFQIYSMLGKTIVKMAPPNIQKFDMEDMGKLVAIVAASEMTREYLIKQKILPEHINI